MLHNPKWQQPTTKADPFSLDNLIAWLEQQPAGAQYSPHMVSACLLALFVRAMGVTDDYEVSDTSYRLAQFSEPKGPFSRIVMGDSSGRFYTFGAALERARALRQGTQE